MGYYLAIPTAVGGFFFSSWLTMIFWGIIAPEFGIKTIGYPLAMLITIALWLIVAPVAAAISRNTRRQRRRSGE